MPMHALARLIEDVRATQGWNQSELGRRAGLSRARIGQLINDPVKAVPSRDTVIQLARGLGLPPWVVMDAYLESLGLPTRPTHITVEDAVRADPSISVEGKEAVLALARHLRRDSVPMPDFSRVQGLRLTEDPSLDPTYDRNSRG